MNYRKNRIKRNYTIEDLENTLDTLPNIIWLKDENGKYAYVNKSFAQTMNLPKEEIIGKSDFDFGNTPMATFFSEDDQNILDNNIPILSENEINIKGKKKWFETFKAPLKRKDNNPSWLMATAREITLYKDLDENIENKLSEYPDSILSLSDNLCSVSNYESTFSQIAYDELLNNKTSNKNNFNMFYKIIRNLSFRLRADGINLFLHNLQKHDLTLYLEVG